MLKKILIVLLVLIAAAAAGLYVFSGKMDGIIKDAIEQEGTAALGSKVSVASVVTDLKEGRAEIGGLNISNAAGYQSPYAIELSSFAAEVDYSDQTIKEIIINRPVINAEQKGQRNNFQDLLANMPSSDESEPEEESTDPGPEITIKKIALTQATVNLLTSDLEMAGQKVDLGNHSFVMQDFVATNVTGTAEEISEMLSNQLVAHVSGQVKGYVQEEIKRVAKAKATEKLKEEANKLLEEKLGTTLDGKLEGGLEGALEGKVDKKKLGDSLKDKFKGFGKD